MDKKTLEHLDRVREAQLSLGRYRRIINQQMNDRSRMLSKHEIELRARRVDGTLTMNGIDEIALSPDLEAVIARPLDNIG